jgi:hypothetical protein
MGQQMNVGIWTLSLFEKILKIMQVKNASMDMTFVFSSPIKHNILLWSSKDDRLNLTSLGYFVILGFVMTTFQTRIVCVP